LRFEGALLLHRAEIGAAVRGGERGCGADYALGVESGRSLEELGEEMPHAACELANLAPVQRADASVWGDEEVSGVRISVEETGDENLME